jgi:hypothetical protein
MDDTDAPDDNAVADLVATLDEDTAQDCLGLIEMMRRISGHEPQIWNVATLGFDTYHYAYDSGREGDGHALAFYPRRGKITLYLMDGTARHADLLAGLGKHTTSKVCIYLKRLSDVDLRVLELVLQQSYDYIKSHDGHMHRA